MAKERLMGKGVASIGMKELIEEIEKKTKELKKSEEKYRELVKNAAEGIYRTTVNGKILEVNPVLLEFFGYENEEEFKAIGDISKVYQNPKDRKKFLKKLKKNGEIKEWEGHYRRKDGKPIITNEFARLIEKNGEEIIEGIIHDVTMERKMTIALEKSREKYRDLFENANDLIWIADRKGRYLSINKMFEEALGYNKKELIGSQSLDLISKKDKKEAIKY
jgi:PAS domain S-box-containing protein